MKIFAKEINGIPYTYITDFAPTKELLSDYQNKKIDWEGYTKVFKQIIQNRKIDVKYNIEDFDNAVFLCSEEFPDKCHRRLLVEYFKEKNPNIKIIHLK